MGSRVKILEATVRDGGYMFDHHYSVADLANLVGGLDQAGFSLIEVGHGNGVGGKYFADAIRPRSFPWVGDEEQARVALQAAGRARVGVCLSAGPRFTPVEYLDTVADLGFHFVRLLALPSEFGDSWLDYVRHAKRRGLTTAVNVMQTYALPPAEIAEIAARSAGCGADWFYVVDSAGGMQRDDVQRYVAAVLERTPTLEVGFHAHNNTGCAVANAIAAVEAGATMVDGTLNGIGRSTGNPPTEQLALALRDRLADPIDLDVLVGLGRAVRSLFEDAANDPLDFVSGAGLIHSRSMAKVLAAARERGRSPSVYLLEVGKEMKRRGEFASLQPSAATLDLAGERAAPAREVAPSPVVIELVAGAIRARAEGGIEPALEELLLRKHQRHKRSVVHLTRAGHTPADRPIAWETADLVGVSVPWSGEPLRVDEARRPDVVAIDHDGEPPAFAAGAVLWRVALAQLQARAVDDLAAAVAARGAPAVRWLEGPEPTDLKAGDTLITVGQANRDAVGRLRAAGVHVLVARWTGGVASAAQAIFTLSRQLDGGEREDAGLLPPVHAPGPGQAIWDPDQASLIDPAEPDRDARAAARVYATALLRGERRF